MARSHVRGGARWALPLGMALVLGLPVGGVEAQDSDRGDEADEEGDGESAAELVFEREVFVYPSHPRDPFRPLTEEEAGPRFEDLTLLGVIAGASPGAGVALVGVGSDGRSDARRLRVGDTLGNVRVVDVRAREIVVEVDELGDVQERVLRVERPGAANGVPDDRDDDGDGDGDSGDGDSGDGDSGDGDGDDTDGPASDGFEEDRGSNGAGGSR